MTADNKPRHQVFLRFQYGGSKRHSDVTNQFVSAMFYKIALFHHDVDSKKCTAMDSSEKCHTIDGSFETESRSKETQFSHTCRLLLKLKPILYLCCNSCFYEYM